MKTVFVLGRYLDEWEVMGIFDSLEKALSNLKEG